MPVFEVNPMFIPTVVFFSPEKQRYAHLIGRFDYETVKEHQERFLRGGLPTFPIAGEAAMRDGLDCKNIKIETEAEMSELDKEILEEILAEERARRAEQASEETEKKKKKKKKSSSAKSDL